MKARIAFLFLLSAAVAGCAGEDRRATRSEAVTPTPVNDADTVASSNKPISLGARSDSIVERLVTAINRGDALELATLSAIPPELPDVRSGQAALEDYQRYFAEAAVESWVRLDNDQLNPEESARVLYELRAENGARKLVMVYYEAQFDTLRAFDEILRYAGRVHDYVDDVLDAIRTGDAGRLAVLISVDDIDYPEQLARTAIDNYAERFDLHTIEPVFSGLDPEAPSTYLRPFLFSIRGEKAGEQMTNQVRITADDGLLSWRDPLFPTVPTA